MQAYQQRYRVAARQPVGDRIPRLARIVGEIKAGAGGRVEAPRVARIDSDGMDVGVDAVVQRLERRTVVARAENSALFDADVHRGRLVRIEGNRADVRDVRRRRKGPSVAAGYFQEAVAFLEQAPAIFAAKEARMRGPDIDAVLHRGRGRERPEFILAR